MSEEKNIEKQPIDDRPPATDGSEKPAEDVSISSEVNKTVAEEETQPQTLTPQPSTLEMEVHHHGHVHEKKKWKEYLFQFFMLFLAVFCGFLAEYQLEHVVERNRAKDYATALYDEIVNDTARLKNIQEDLSNNSKYLDTLFDLMNSPSVKTIPGGELYYYAAIGLGNRQFSPTDATLQQLKNSGSLRYFRNPDLIKAIANYDQSVRNGLRIEEVSLSILNELRKTQMRIFNFKIYRSIINWSIKNEDSLSIYKKMNLPILSYESSLLGEFTNWALLRAGHNMGGRIPSYQNTLKIARQLIDILKKEYHLK
jgi:hypothetical protein